MWEIIYEKTNIFYIWFSHFTWTVNTDTSINPSYQRLHNMSVSVCSHAVSSIQWNLSHWVDLFVVISQTKARGLCKSLRQGFRKSFSAWGLNFKQFSSGFTFEIVGHNYKDFINKNKHVQHRCTSALNLWESNQKEMTDMKHMVYIMKKSLYFFFFKSMYMFAAFNTNQMFPEWLLSAVG